MKSLKITLSLLFFFALFSSSVFAAESNAVVEKETSAVVAEQADANVVQDKQVTEKLTIKEKFILKRMAKFVKKNQTLNPAEDEVLLVILAILLPPLAVYLLEGVTTNFWIDLILTLFFWLPGIIFALYLILR